jgi:serine-type D-Ala-D-Ala endopeptidase (penicillin-binding protein 7)
MDVLLNWLVQGIVVAIAAAAGLRVIPSARAQARYGFVWLAYLLLMVLPAVPGAVAALAIEVRPVDLAPVSAGAVDVAVGWWKASTIALWLWVAWSLFHAARFAGGALAVRRAKRHSQDCPADVLSQLPHWSRLAVTGRPTRVILSDRVRFAAVLGCGFPVIALAPDLPDQLSVEDLDRVLCHEWAHVQRRDDLAQLVQQLVRAIVGWHPAAWWLDRQLELEREVACDAAAVRVTGSAKGYAACLVTLTALPRTPVRSLPGLAAISTPQLRRRVVRILTTRWITSSRGWSVGAICGAAGLAALALAVSHVRALAPTPPPTTGGGLTFAPNGPTAAADAPSASNHIELNQSPATATLARRTSSDAPRLVVVRETKRLEAEPLAIQGSRNWVAELPQTALLPIDTPLSAPDTPARLDPAVIGGSGPAADNSRAPWTSAADAGVAIGRTSKGAAVATGGFFSRVGKTIASSF